MAFTFFFRDLPILQSAADLFVHETAGRSRVRIWNAGCAMGPETYTLLICLAERIGRFAFQNILVDATDIDEGGDFGTVIANGIYPASELSRIPEELLAKYFAPVEGRDGFVQVAEALRNRIRYSTSDLTKLVPAGSGYAMIVCKNVLLHVSYEDRVKVLTMFADALADGGFVVMEHTQKMPTECMDRYEVADSVAQIYRKKSVTLAKVA